MRHRKVSFMKESKFQFAPPYLEEISFREGGNKPENKYVDLNNMVKVQIAQDEGASKAIVKLIITIEAGKSGGLFALNIKMVSVFTWNDLDDEQIDNLLRKNAPALLLSYARPLIASITNASKFPTYNIPFLDFSTETINVTTLDGED